MIRSLLFVAGFAAALSGCEVTTEPPASEGPAANERSLESLKLEAYYASVQSRLKVQGLLRTDGGGPDVPFTTRNLVDNFERVALFDEYTIRNNRFVAQQTPSHLRRWESPIRIALVFGDQVSASQKAKDTASVRAYAARLSRLTGLSITLSNKNPNFHVLFIYKGEEDMVGPRLAAVDQNVSSAIVNEITATPRNVFCAAYAFAEQTPNSPYSSAVLLIKAEHPDLMRLSCIHEEMAQALGLSNDSPKARPSIFNDDEEFALLTRHDELLLQILYDRRLSLGMTANTARPVVTRIANELAGGES